MWNEKKNKLRKWENEKLGNIEKMIELEKRKNDNMKKCKNKKIHKWRNAIIYKSGNEKTITWGYEKLESEKLIE